MAPHRFAKGEGRGGGTGKGRAKGVPNKATALRRAGLEQLLNYGFHHAASWLRLVAEGRDKRPGNPRAALALLADLNEFDQPRLARQELDARVAQRVVEVRRTYREGDAPAPAAPLEEPE
jgi:hypothetical protein